MMHTSMTAAQVLAPTVHGMPDGEKPAARQKLLNGPLGERLAALDKRLVSTACITSHNVLLQ